MSLHGACYGQIYLQVQHPLFDFLRPSLVPELCPDITAGTSRHIHFILVAVAAVGAFPQELSVLFHNLDLACVTALLAEITLGVQFRNNNFPL